MDTHEYALLVAVATPVLVILGLNVCLWWEGERGTLLMPSSEALPSFAEEARSEPAIPVGCEAAFVAASLELGVVPAVPANDEHVREAA